MSDTACLYCDGGERLRDAMIEVGTLEVSTLHLFRDQTYPGRCVVAFKDHVAELYELGEDDRTRFIRDVARSAGAISAAVGAEKMNYGAYGDKTPHLHFHLVPKRSDLPDWGGMFQMMPTPSVLLTDERYAATIASIRARL